MTVNKEDQRTVTPADIAAILVTNCGLDTDAAAAQPEASLQELGLDSLAVLELQAVVADRYGVQIPETSAELSVGDIAGLVARGGA